VFSNAEKAAGEAAGAIGGDDISPGDRDAIAIAVQIGDVDALLIVKDIVDLAVEARIGS
jgi:class 3 adenylate cyclase